MRVHLVDGTFELYRAHFSPRPSRTAPDGRDVKAAVGVVEQLLTLLGEADEAVTHLAVAFDNPIRSFRNDLYDGYKSDEGVPPELRAQFDLVEELVGALGVRVWSMRDFEADDALATAAHVYAPVAEQIRILSPDKDLMQCVSDGGAGRARVVVVDRIRKTVVDEAGVVAKWGVGPGAIASLLALTGDSADGFPGLPGFGAKTAAALLAAFGTLEAIPDDPAKWPKAVRGAERLAKLFAASRAEVSLYRTLATLRTDAPIDADVDALRVGALGGPALAALCQKLGAERVSERADTLRRPV